MSEIKPIETVYAGYRFRSRLEARWAVYFDARKIEYEYEPEGWDLGELGWYLPDFWLPQVSMWAEVKAGEFSELEAAKCKALALGTGYPCLLLHGAPDLRNYWAYEPEEWEGHPELATNDYLLHGSPYWLDEARFFGCTGAGEWEIKEYPQNTSDFSAVSLARRARFDRGGQ